MAPTRSTYLFKTCAKNTYAIPFLFTTKPHLKKKKKSVGLPLLGAKTYSFKHVQTQRLSTPNGRVFERIEWVKQKYQAPPPRA